MLIGGNLRAQSDPMEADDRRIGSFMRMEADPMDEDQDAGGSDSEEAALADVRAMFNTNLHLPNSQQQVRSPAPAGPPPPPPPPRGSPQGEAPQ